MIEKRLSTAIWLAPAAAALAPTALLLTASVTSMSAEAWIQLPFWLPLWALWSLVVGYPIALLHMMLAWFFYRLLRPHLPLRWWIAGGAGGLIGALPVAALQAFMRTGAHRNMLDLGTGGLELPLLFGGAGIVGGLTFWWILRASEAEADPA